MNGVRRLGALMAMAVLLAASAAGADEDGGPRQLEVTSVVTGTRTPEQLQRATVKTDVVTREEAVQRGATNVAEALATQPSVQVNPGAYGYLGKVSPIQMQGFDLNRVLILENGEPVIGDVGGAIDLAAIPVADLDRIEIVTGPSSALYGSSAMGGVINLLTSAPREQGASGRARAEFRSNRGVVLDGSGAYRAGDAWLGLELGLTRSDGLTLDPALPDLQLPATLRTSLGLRAGVQQGQRVEVQFQARWLHQNIDGLESKVYPGLGRYLIDTPETTDRLSVRTQATWRPTGDLSLRLSLSDQLANNTTKTVPRGSPLSDAQRTTQSLPSAEATGTLAEGPRTWVLGARVESQRVVQDLQKTERVAGELVTRVQPEVAPTSLDSAALYAQLIWKLGKWLTVLPGVRAEYHGLYGGVVAPRLALSLKPTSELILRASAGRGFRTPSPEELGFDFDHSIYGYKVVGNPDLTPESSWGVNGDVSWRPGDHWSLHGSAFGNWVRHLIDIDLASGSASGTVVTYTYRNFEKVRTAGAQAGVGFRVSDWLSLDASYDYLWTRDDTNDVPLGGRAPHTVTLSASGRLPWDLEAYGRFHVVSGSFVDTAQDSPAYETLDLRLARALWSRSQAYLGVLNLFDVHQVPGQVGDLRPPQGRVLYAGIRAAFPWEQE